MKVSAITDEYLTEKYPVYMAGYKRKEELRTVGEFLEWLEGVGYCIYEYRDLEDDVTEWDAHERKYVTETVVRESQLCRVNHDIETLMLMFLELDPKEYRKQQAAAQDEILREVRNDSG